MHSPAVRHPAVTASFWMMGSLTSFVAMAIGGRELAAARMTTFEILLFRSLVGLVIVSMLLARSGWGQISAKRFGLQHHVFSSPSQRWQHLSPSISDGFKPDASQE